MARESWDMLPDDNTADVAEVGDAETSDEASQQSSDETTQVPTALYHDLIAAAAPDEDKALNGGGSRGGSGGGGCGGGGGGGDPADQDGGGGSEGAGQDGVAIFVPLPTVRRYNLLSVGSTGCGKTTFCDTFRRYFPDFEWTTDDVDAVAPHSPTTEIVKRGSATRIQRDTSIKLEVWDTPGFGDTMNSEDRFVPVEHFIESNHVAYEEGEFYRRAEQQVDDPRIHCCFYFISPHRVTPLDIEFMRRLQSKVCLVPIVAKADTMTLAERAWHLRQIHAKLRDERIGIFDFGRSEDVDESWLSGDTDADVTALRQIRNVFAIVSGQRHYPWGAADEDTRAHSDAPRLRDRLFVDGGLEALLESTDCRHADWVNSFRVARRDRARLGLVRFLKWHWVTPAVSWLKLTLLVFVLFWVSLCASALYGRATIVDHSSCLNELGDARGELDQFAICAVRSAELITLGNSLLLVDDSDVITLLTEKCYLTLMCALQMIHGGVPAGSVGATDGS